jgi:hypothetical protein
MNEAITQGFSDHYSQEALSLASTYISSILQQRPLITEELWWLLKMSGQLESNFFIRQPPQSISEVQCEFSFHLSKFMC